MSSQIVILSGEPGSGKTTACRQLVERVRQQRLDCAGILSPARFEGTQKVGIDLLNLRTDECRSLAEADDQPGALRTGKYRFDVETMQWGMACLDAACPCDVLLVDELGPLELERGEGWVNALDSLRSGLFKLAVVVVRPRLIETFAGLMGTATPTVFTLPLSRPDDLPGTLQAQIRA